MMSKYEDILKEEDLKLKVVNLEMDEIVFDTDENEEKKVFMEELEKIKNSEDFAKEFSTMIINKIVFDEE
jgi:hypothetical protein